MLLLKVTENHTVAHLTFSPFTCQFYIVVLTTDDFYCQLGVRVMPINIFFVISFVKMFC